MHEMKLQSKYFNYILNGTKRVELRLYDEKRRNIKVNDTIIFKEEGNPNNSFLVRVVSIKIDNAFEELIKDFKIEQISSSDESKEKLLSDLEVFYPIEKQKENKVIALTFELI